ncbi:DUF192 domain-containing protein [Sulfuricystis multivorans]|uniref:DUF192 domain-containing protein n=1 Tax=Sulfuricystis multivorans TaxID=2211108 RepID=UPI000F840287|nr:DUF192 domain-containing protein [Sulfuricystis multivorans]
MKAPVMLAALLLARAALAQSLPVIELNAGIHRIEAEVAASPAARIRGLMQRTTLPPARGMLFVFDQEARHCMWMKNTYLPLSVAFLDATGRIINIEEMQPQTLDNHCAARPARYALEMNAGWFAQRGIRAGDAISGIGQVPPAH